MKPEKLLLGLLLPGIAAMPARAASYAGNGNDGFGGVISSLDINDDGTDITFTLHRGPGSLNDAFVLYIDSVSGVSGGAGSTAGFTDTGDPLRRAISGFDGSSRSTVHFSSGFGTDFALGLEGGFAGLWAVSTGGSHGFVAVANAAPGGTSQASYAMTVSLASLGLAPGDSFDFVATYLNPNNAYRSDEGIGDGLPSDNPGHSDVSFTGFRTYTTVPEPAVALLGSLGLLALLRRRK